tara:strand:- start:223 stop:3711 length:3489 start_codon:yes stop_codon:yes gene_type:complete
MDPIENIFELGTNYGKISSQPQDLPQAEVVTQDSQENYEAFSIINELNNIEQGELTETEILNNPNLVEGIRNIMKARYSEETRNKFSFDEKYDRDISDKDLIQEWQNWMRSLAGGQTVTTGNDVAWFATADDQQRALMGASFEIMDKMPSIFDDNVTWAETLDGVRDYVRAGVWDPSTVLGLGVGRLFTKATAKGATMGLRHAAKEAGKNALKRGMSKQAAKELEKKVLKKSFRNAGLKKNLPPVIAGMSTDAAIAVGTDQLYQGLRIGSGVQDHKSLPQSAGAALGVIVIPGLVATTKAGTKAMSRGLNFKNYTDVMSKFSGKDPDTIMSEVVARVDNEKVNKDLRKTFKDFEDNMDTYLPWSVAREAAAKEVVKSDIDGSPSALEDLFESIFLFGKPEKGITQKGFIYSMAEAGFVYVPRGKDDTVSNFIADAMKKTVTEDTLNAYTKAFKDKFKTKDLKAAGIFNIKTPEELGDWFINRSRFAGKTMFNRKAAQDILNKDIDNITAKDLLDLHKTSKEVDDANATPADRVKYIQSVWKRLLTSHPSTTGLNIKGWAYTTGLNNLSDVVLGAVLGLQGRGIEAKGSIIGAVRRGYNVLDFDATVEQGLNYLKFKPEVAKDLLSEISGGVESRDILNRLNLDPKSKINQASEKTVSAIQAAAGVRLQDEVTKMISFMSALDQNIMKVYGVSFNKFMAREDAYVEMFSPKFLKEVQEPAITRAKKETYSYSWITEKGSGPFLEMAKYIERFSNSPGGGFLIPFGRFFNTVTAMVGDYTGFNAAKHVLGKVYKKENPLDDEGQLLFSKGVVGIGLIFGPGSYNGTTSEYEAAKERVRNGQSWNFQPLPDGSRRDVTYDAPLNYTRIIAQALAHRSLDGKVPDPLKEEIFQTLIGQTFRGTGEAYETLKDYGQVILDGDLDNSFVASYELLSGSFARVASGGLRFLEPVNAVATYATGDFANPDRRQGNKDLNNIFKYVENIPNMIGIETSDLPERNIATRGQANYDAGRILGGARGDRGPSPSERLAASVGLKAWQAMDFQGEPELKNRLDDFVQELFNVEASKAIENGVLEKPLKQRQKEFRDIKQKVKKRARSLLGGSSRKSDKLLELESKVLSKPKLLKDRAVEFLGYEGRIEDLKDMEDGEGKLKFLLYLMNNEDLMFD